jgi:hypothetical protein
VISVVAHNTNKGELCIPRQHMHINIKYRVNKWEVTDSSYIIIIKLQTASQTYSISVLCGEKSGPTEQPLCCRHIRSLYALFIHILEYRKAVFCAVKIGKMYTVKCTRPDKYGNGNPLTITFLRDKVLFLIEFCKFSILSQIKTLY